MKNHLLDVEATTDIWGANAESLFLFLSDIEQGTDLTADAIKLETFRTNVSKDEDIYKTALQWLSTHLGFLTNGNLTPLGKMVLIGDDPVAMIRACLFSRDYRIRSFFTEVIIKRIQHVRFSEFESYFPGEATCYAKLLVSFGFLELNGKTIKLNISTIHKAGKVRKFPQAVGNWLCAKSFFEILIGKSDACTQKLISELTSELLTNLGVAFKKDGQNLTLVEAIKHIGNAVPELFEIISTNPEAISNVLENVQAKYSQENKCIREHLTRLEIPAASAVQVERERLEHIAREFHIDYKRLSEIVHQISTLHKGTLRVYLSYVANSIGISKIEAASLLADLFRDDIRIDSNFASFMKRILTDNSEKANLDAYWDFVLQEYSRTMENIQRLTEAREYLLKSGIKFTHVIQSNVCRIENRLVSKILSKRFSPFYFVYTLPNPDNLGKEVVKEFVGNNEFIQREIYKLSSEWPLARTEFSFSYTDMTDKLFSKGLEHDLATKELRIMTPYTDYELKKYVSMIRRLVKRGFKLYVLCRLSSDPRPWNILKESLFEGLGEKAKSVKIRTYTRFKRFLPISKLSKTKKSRLGEFGVHAKLFIVGDPDDGAVLLGSANLLENSFNWNPECGTYTEDPSFIKSAKNFFDFVWDLSKHDALDLSDLGRIPRGPFFPHYYIHG